MQKVRKRFPSKVRILVSVVVLLALLLIAWLYIGPKTADAPQPDTKSMQQQPEVPREPPYKEPNLQPVVDAWVARQPASYSIVVYDAQSETRIAEHNPEEVMFAASLYKLYVAYLGLQDFQSGVQDANEILINGHTKKECVDLMIRESNSPCGEAMMAAMGQLNLNTRVKNLDIADTTFNGIQTTAADSAEILKRIQSSEELSAENTAFLRDAMRNQPAEYKRGLQKGAPKGKWDTKVGWNLDINYHDVGILTMPDGREFVVAILGQGSGSPVPIADFASTLYSALEN